MGRVDFKGGERPQWHKKLNGDRAGEGIQGGVANTKDILKKSWKPGVVAHAFNPSTREAEAGGFLSSRPAWSTK
jgi:major histocompatibility complex class I